MIKKIITIEYKNNELSLKGDTEDDETTNAMEREVKEIIDEVVYQMVDVMKYEHRKQTAPWWKRIFM